MVSDLIYKLCQVYLNSLAPINMRTLNLLCIMDKSCSESERGSEYDESELNL